MCEIWSGGRGLSAGFMVCSCRSGCKYETHWFIQPINILFVCTVPEWSRILILGIASGYKANNSSRRLDNYLIFLYLILEGCGGLKGTYYIGELRHLRVGFLVLNALDHLLLYPGNTCTKCPRYLDQWFFSRTRRVQCRAGGHLTSLMQIPVLDVPSGGFT